MPLAIPTLEIIARLLPALRKPRAHAEVTGPWGSAKSVIAMQAAAALERPLLYLTASRTGAEAVHEDLGAFLGEDRAILLPAWETLPTDAMDPADDIVAERMDALERLARGFAAGEPLCAVMPARSLLQRVASRRQLAARSLVLETGAEHDLDALLAKFIGLGYEREVMVEHRGQFSLRGGILDIFPISGELPYRLEFFGDEIESIRRFEPETQRSVDHCGSVRVLPRSEKEMLAAEARQGALESVASYFPKQTLVALDEPLAIREEIGLLAAQFKDSAFMLGAEEAADAIARFTRLSLAQVSQDRASDAARFSAPMQVIAGWSGQPGGFWDQLKAWDAEGFRVLLLCVNSGERRRLLELIEEHGYRPGTDGFDLRIEIGRLRAGFVSPADKLAMLSEKEMFGRHYVRRKRRRFEASAAVTQFSDLKSGDYVVHEHHGIGRYQGLRRFAGKAGDFMGIQYSGGDTLYVPVTHIDQVQKYTGGDGAVPKIDRIGGATWARTRARVKKAVRDMTEELVKLYAAREKGRGHAFAPDTPWQREFEDAFEYEETPDQKRAIEEIKRAMESPEPMDRLLCGDVGFGKTEVALRAAFKAVQDGKQVALLAPTTVLVQQHYTTFRERMADYPVRVEQVSRFRSAKEQKDALARLAAGEADIVIGTHRLLSKDVRFRDLGLLVIDEEQRFGVAHKERLKQLRTHVDVLTMSATPIPRTLNFSLMGVRDMSLINTAPNDRLPVHTCIETWDENLIKEAIERELAREGQVFFLHNRVQTIGQIATLLRKLVPGARIAVGHGQMKRHELEDVMSAFIEREYDVLLCTTIIASGIDIPNANTIIVDRADAFGLAELYQIRGRVGRYKHRAFAYLLVPGDRALTEEAQQRLKALEEFSHLGAGFRIAMRDMEIRGCGNILGAEQHGNIVTVGYETYKDLIAEAVAEIKGEAPRRVHLPPFEINVDAHIPESYVPSAPQKITLYRRISGVQSPEEVDEMFAELKDRFGQPPGPVRRLLEVMRVRTHAASLGVERMAAAGAAVVFVFASPRFLSQRAQRALETVFGEHLDFSWKEKPEITYRLDADADPVRETLNFLKAIQEL